MTHRDQPQLRYVPSPAEEALARAVLDIEQHMSEQGWDGPVGVFALVRTIAAAEADPQFAAVLDADALARARTDPEDLTVIEQEDLPAATDLEDLLAQLAWPADVDGVAVSVERLTVPPSAEAQAAEIADPDERLAFLQAHAQRQDVRIVVGVLRTGQSWCAVRYRSHDSEASVVQGPSMVPGLIEALASTLE